MNAQAFNIEENLLDNANAYRPPMMMIEELGIAIATTPITQNQYKWVDERGIPYLNTAHNYKCIPKVNITLKDAKIFCNELSELENLKPAYTNRLHLIPNAEGYRLPTWEEYQFVSQDLRKIENPKGLLSYGHFYENTTAFMKVANLEPNQYGLYDLVGTIDELLERTPGNPQDITGFLGNFSQSTTYYRSKKYQALDLAMPAHQIWYHKRNTLGFRVVLPL